MNFAHRIHDPWAEEPPAPFRFTSDVVSRLWNEGLLGARRVELIEGEIFVVPEEGVIHHDLRDRVVSWFYVALLTAGYPEHFVSTNAPLRSNESDVPEPDVYVRPGNIPLKDLPPDQVKLGIELAFTSHSHDFKRKAPVYARAGLPELWIIDGVKRLVVVHRGPLSDGTWREMKGVEAGETVSPLAFPGLQFRLADHLSAEDEEG